MNQNESESYLKSSLPDNLTVSFLTTSTTSWTLSPRENEEQSIYLDGCKVATVYYSRLEFLERVSLPGPLDLQLLMIREHLMPRDISSVVPKWSTQDGKILLFGKVFFNWLDSFDITKVDKYQFKSGQLIVSHFLQPGETEKRRVKILWKNPVGDYVLCNAQAEALVCRGSMLSLIDSILSIQRQTWAINECRKFVTQRQDIPFY